MLNLSVFMEKKGKRVKPSIQRLQAKGEISTLQAGKDIKAEVIFNAKHAFRRENFFSRFQLYAWAYNYVCVHGCYAPVFM